MYPRSVGHFYEKNIVYDDYDLSIQNQELIKQAQKKVSIEILVPNDRYKGNGINFVLYKTHTGNEPKYMENYNLVDNFYLNILNNSNMHYKIF